jgi:hypothetical protein
MNFIPAQSIPSATLTAFHKKSRELFQITKSFVFVSESLRL